jgi:hypothetical protein
MRATCGLEVASVACHTGASAAAAASSVKLASGALVVAVFAQLLPGLVLEAVGIAGRAGGGTRAVGVLACVASKAAALARRRLVLANGALLALSWHGQATANMELSGRAVVRTLAAGGCAPGELEAPIGAVIALVGAHGGLKLPCRTHLAVHLAHLLLVLALATVSAANGTGSRRELACSARCADGGVPGLGLKLAS